MEEEVWEVGGGKVEVGRGWVCGRGKREMGWVWRGMFGVGRGGKGWDVWNMSDGDGVFCGLGVGW